MIYEAMIYEAMIYEAMIYEAMGDCAPSLTIANGVHYVSQYEAEIPTIVAYSEVIAKRVGGDSNSGGNRPH
jgi:hypothetical protein